MVAESDLRAAVPFLTSVTPLASAGGGLTLRGTATFLGLSATVDATVSESDGKLVVKAQPTRILTVWGHGYKFAQRTE